MSDTAPRSLDVGRLAQATALLRSLVAVPSVTPRSEPPSPAAPGERALAELVLSWCAERGIEASSHEALPGRPNVVAVVPGRSPRAVVLEVHLDTVETAGMTVDPYAGEVRHGRLYGRGACDAKGSLTAYLMALEELAAAAQPPPVTVVLAAVADEEHRYRGVVEYLDRQELDLLGAVVGEPTELAAGVAHNGVVRFTVHVEGRSGHSSRPAEADSAVVRAMELIARIEQTPGSAATHPVLGRPTRTVVRVAAGEGPNVVPGHCEFDVDRRTLPGEDPMAVWAEIGRELAAAQAGHVRLDEPFVVDHALDTASDAAVVTALTAQLGARGLPAAPVGLSFCSDASKFSLRGVPAVVFGPGSICDAHTHDESVELAQVLLAADVVLDTICSLRGTA